MTVSDQDRSAAAVAEPVLESIAGVPDEDLKNLPKAVAAELNRRRRAVLDLEASEQYSRSLFDAAEAGLIIVDLRTKQIMDVNRAAALALGAQDDEILGRQASVCGVEGLCNSVTAEGGAIERCESQLRRCDGSMVPVIVSATALAMHGQPLAVVSFVDVSQVHAAKQQLEQANGRLEDAMVQLNAQRDAIIQSEKMASIGQLAAGVAHEINNPIGYVTSNLGTLGEYVAFMRTLIGIYGRLVEMPADDPGRASLLTELAETLKTEDLDFILSDLDSVLKESAEGTARVASIVQNLKSFARDDSMQLRAYDLNEGVESMVRMVWNELKYSCTVEKELQQLPPVMCHAGRVNQVVMNILVNAAHAIGPQGGVITIRTRATESEAIVSISDTGCGMSPETRSRIFEPFFTTKDVGKGTGLGLSISHGIIADHGGHIDVESEVGKGSTFHIVLPLAPEPTEDLIG